MYNKINKISVFFNDMLSLNHMRKLVINISSCFNESDITYLNVATLGNSHVRLTTTVESENLFKRRRSTPVR